MAAVFNTPRKSKIGFKPDLFDSAAIFDGQDLDLMWTTISDVAYMANLYRNSAPESHWIGSVVAPLLHLVRRLSLFKIPNDRDRPLLEVLDMYVLEFNLP